ncbi:uncharacterized protein M421DRAFT_376396 [Didymella exigua CBS 183.55]|uniref:Uncharacterized protein n=1 Tax=Didymella exigua CBS 183.55 TaxID=1150837 RepID=A0A6A5RQ25_9PLEO|nr:uncharacterized protein M421DRAFT_376396 [Didymella exigua CBS 183.55]KAF1930541.1 hypothetical protein M421DRAFT_376396 [Didymella exigua CBS 183.55]
MLEMMVRRSRWQMMLESNYNVTSNPLRKRCAPSLRSPETDRSRECRIFPTPDALVSPPHNRTFHFSARLLSPTRCRSATIPIDRVSGELAKQTHNDYESAVCESRLW